MRGAKSNALLLMRANCHRACPCVALVFFYLSTAQTGLRNYWMGHAGRDMSDLCDEIKEDVAFRREWAERSGFGFELPSVVPNVPAKAT